VACEKSDEVRNMDEHDGQDNDPGDSHEPLIAREDDMSTQERRHQDEDGHTAEHRGGTGRSIWLLTLSAGISGLLFGYE